MTTRKEYYALLRQDFNSFFAKTFQTVVPGTNFLPNWHLQAIAHHLMLVARGDLNRLIITVPPRMGKSLLATVAFPAWLLGHDPTKRIICVSYSQDLAETHAHDMRKMMQDPLYQKLFPGTRFDQQKSPLKDLATTMGGYRLSTSVNGTLTGRGGDLIIVDDIHKAQEVTSDQVRKNAVEFFRNTLVSRLNNSDDPIVVIQQRIHESDLVGVLLESEGWYHLNLPAIAEEDEWIEIGDDEHYWREEGSLLHPERLSQEALDERKRALGSYNYSAQYQQRPAPLGGGVIQWDWFVVEKSPRWRRENDMLVQSWDPAQSITEHADFTVCTTWLIRDSRFHLINVLRFKAKFPDVLKRVISEAHRRKPNVILIEAVAHGKSLYDSAVKEAGCPVLAGIPRGDKVSRMVGETGALEAGLVVVPPEADWLPAFQHEMVEFPNGKHDDQVDSLSQMLYWARMRGPLCAPLRCRISAA